MCNRGFSMTFLSLRDEELLHASSCGMAVCVAKIDNNGVRLELLLANVEGFVRQLVVCLRRGASSLDCSRPPKDLLTILRHEGRHNGPPLFFFWENCADAWHELVLVVAMAQHDLVLRMINCV